MGMNFQLFVNFLAFHAVYRTTVGTMHSPPHLSTTNRPQAQMRMSLSRPPRHRRLLCWIVFFGWLGYSGALLGWAAANAPPADACIVR
jgi:hypothetical protein